MTPIEPGCEAVVAAMHSWMAASQVQDIATLEQFLAPEFQFTTTPDVIPNCRLDKAGFLAMVSKFHDSELRLLDIVATRMDGIVLTMMFVEVHEQVSGDLGEGMPDAATISAMVDGHSFAYASAWREEAGRWLCTSHNVLGKVR